MPPENEISKIFKPFANPIAIGFLITSPDGYRVANSLSHRQIDKSPH